MTETELPTVLIVEDEPSVAEGYELWLTGEYEIERASDGKEALERIDDTVDVVLLDRMMPEMSGTDVLGEIRKREIDCRVAMVTAVEPDFDVIEMGFDAYITKPPERAELVGTIEKLLDRAAATAEMQTYHSLMERRSALEAEKTQAELEDSEEYQKLCERIERKEAEVDEGLGDMGSETDFVGAVRELEGDGDISGEREGERDSSEEWTVDDD